MDLDRISVEARLRSPWEALDLGFVMARQWWLPLFLSWVVPSGIVFIVLSLIFTKNSWVPYVVVWWLKPLWDRGPLYIASRRLFGEEAGARDVFRNLWRLYKTDWFVWLTVRRLSVTRSFDMPLTVLEKITKDKRSDRQLVLHRNHSNAATWLTMAGVCIEVFFVIAIFSFMAMMVPEQVEIDYWNLFFEQDTILVWVYNFSIFVSMCLVGPFFAVAGFALYISRRIELEAWDIEIRFRHLASVYEKKRDAIGGNKPLTSLLLCACMLFAGLLVPADHVLAAEPSADEYSENTSSSDDSMSELAKADEASVTISPAAKASKEDMFEILQGDKFHIREVRSGWRLKDFDLPEEEGETPGWFITVLKFIWKILKAIGKFFALLLKPLEYIVYVLWVLVAILIVYLIYRFREPIGNFVASTEPVKLEHEAPEVMFGLNVTKESLPDDIPANVRALWQQQDYRAAVSLLYRALLTGLIHDYDFAFEDSHTEGECVTLVQERGDNVLSPYVVKLTACWQNLAYGHMVPRWEDVDLLCDSWSKVFPDE
ncbi:hypothetical protein SAMN02745866_01583 [Alteromonadaceae bacterium Bs31]|nr:hypothetical protein SAMN02745866_01583 [Alteromonadaceae bacterium Bs31]